MSSMLVPASRFSKTIATGIRVSRNTQAPLTFAVMLSTAGHCDQSSAGLERLLQTIEHLFDGCQKDEKNARTPGKDESWLKPAALKNQRPKRAAPRADSRRQEGISPIGKLGIRAQLRTCFSGTSFWTFLVYGVDKLRAVAGC